MTLALTLVFCWRHTFLLWKVEVLEKAVSWGFCTFIFFFFFSIIGEHKNTSEYNSMRKRKITETLITKLNVDQNQLNRLCAEYWDSDIWLGQTSTMEFFCENNLWLWAVNLFRKKTPWQMSGSEIRLSCNLFVTPNFYIMSYNFSDYFFTWVTFSRVFDQKKQGNQAKLKNSRKLWYLHNALHNFRSHLPVLFLWEIGHLAVFLPNFEVLPTHRNLLRS